MATAGDSPIRDQASDLLERSALVDAFVRHLFALESGEGVVAAVLGPWGSGKTSFLNMARDGLASSSSAVIDFNPWMFSGADQLVERFFVEIAAQLELEARRTSTRSKVDGSLTATASRWLEYGDVLAGWGSVPVVGTWIERVRLVAGGAKKVLDRRRAGIGDRRRALEEELARLAKPIVVVLDDMDRLTTAEIRDVFKLVRLTANFRNVIYVLAFDRHRVEAALSEDGIPGRDYLEKIVAFELDLPPVPGRLLPRLLTDALDGALAGVSATGPFDSAVWTDLLYEVVLPQVRNVRDIRRYAAAVPPTVEQLNGAVALADVLALESVRVFMPDVFTRLHASLDALTSTSDLVFGSHREDHGAAELLRALVEAGGRNEAVARAMLARLFPASQGHLGGSHYGSEWKKTWLRERRVAHPEVMRRYLEAVGSPELSAFDLAERAWVFFGNPPDLDSFRRSLEPEVLPDVVASLETFEGTFAAEHAAGVIIVLLNLHVADTAPKHPLALDARTAVARVVLRLLWAVTPRDAAAVDASKIESLVLAVLPQLTRLSAQLELLTIVGHEPGAGHKLVTETFADARQVEWAARANAATAEELATEPDLLRVLVQRADWSRPGSPAAATPDGPALTQSVLLGAVQESHSWAMGSRSVRRSKRLAWETVVRVFGGEDATRSRLEELKASGLDDPGGVVGLAEQYLDGWRPDRDA